MIAADGRRVDELTGEGREGCGFGPCVDALERGGRGCHLCDVIAHLKQPRGRVTADPQDEKEQNNPERDGAPTLAGTRERRHPMWEKRHRDGPHRGNA